MLEQSDKYVGMTLIEAENAIIEEFSMYEEWLDKYEYLIELGKSLKDYPEEAKTDDKLIKGCQSRVWLDYKVQDGNIVFNADSDAIITKGIISLLIGLYSGRTAQEILSSDFSVVEIMNLERDIIRALRQVYDPEIPVNVYDLGLIYEIKVNEEHEVDIQMTLTAPNCPMADYVVSQVQEAVKDVPGVVDVRIDLVFEPVWDRSRMSEEALVELGLDVD